MRGARGVLRRDGDEVLLRSTSEVVGGMPVLECSNCGYRMDHYFWYEDNTYARRIVKRCPGCDYRIFGVVVRDG